MQKDTETVIQVFEWVKAKMCEEYCKWPGLYRGDENAFDRLLDERCAHCPLNRL